MTLLIYDTLRRQKIAFEPADPKRVTMYVCGPTVYSYAHIGNARPVVVFDVLFRLLRELYGPDNVIYARNITDVDDKINKAAMDQGVEIGVITNKFADIYNEDMATLGALKPTHQPRATEHMHDMVVLIERLISRGLAYVSEGEVLFDVAKYDGGSGRYGKLAGRQLDDMIAGARVEVAENKDNAADFVLWKPSKPWEPAWSGPQGLMGRPGWHIECSAMSEAVLKLPIDIHGGGHDLIFPHHTNEIAQSCAAHGHSDPNAYARYWMHNGFLDFGKEKMSKSLGNVKLVHELIKEHPGEVLRLALLSAHYRAPLDWTPELLEQSRAILDGYYQTLRDVKHVDRPVTDDRSMKNSIERSTARHLNTSGFTDALFDDLNTPKALASLGVLRDTVRLLLSNEDHVVYSMELMFAKSALLKAGSLIGLLQQDPEAWFKGGASDDLSAQIDALLAERITARAAKNWPEADRIRKTLDELGVEVMDSATGATWKMKVKS